MAGVMPYLVKVIEGTEVIDKIKVVKTGRHGMHDDVPVEISLLNQRL